MVRTQGRPVFKAFAKHLKLERQKAMLAEGCYGMVAGTPHRLAALASVGALHLDHLRLLVVDVRIDAKQQCAYASALHGMAEVVEVRHVCLRGKV